MFLGLVSLQSCLQGVVVGAAVALLLLNSGKTLIGPKRVDIEARMRLLRSYRWLVDIEDAPVVNASPPDVGQRKHG